MTVLNFLGGLSVVVIFVEKGKGFLELCNLLRQFLCNLRVQHDVLCF